MKTLLLLATLLVCKVTFNDASENEPTLIVIRDKEHLETVLDAAKGKLIVESIIADSDACEACYLANQVPQALASQHPDSVVGLEINVKKVSGFESAILPTTIFVKDGVVLEKVEVYDPLRIIGIFDKLLKLQS